MGDALREEGYLLASLLSAADMRKSSYFYQVGTMKADRDPVFGIFDDNERAYGRRRIHDEIGIIVGKRRISRILKEQGRIAFGCKSYKKNKRYDSYEKEIFEHPNNKVKQDFTAGLPNFLVALRRHALHDTHRQALPEPYPRLLRQHNRGQDGVKNAEHRDDKLNAACCDLNHDRAAAQPSYDPLRLRPPLALARSGYLSVKRPASRGRCRAKATLPTTSASEGFLCNF